MQITGLEDIHTIREKEKDGEIQEDEDAENMPIDPVLLPKNTLMHLLSGNQKTKRKSSISNTTTTRPKIRKEASTGTSFSNDVKLINDNCVISDLEKKIYSSAKRISAKDLLCNSLTRLLPKRSKVIPSILNVNDDDFNIDDDPISDDSDAADTTQDIEAKIFANKKSTTVKDLFNNFKPKKMITLKLAPELLRKCSSDLLQADNKDDDMTTIESKIYANAKSVSVHDIFKQDKPSKFVRLKLSPELLLKHSSDISEEDEELCTSDIERMIYGSKPKASVFDILNSKKPVESKSKKSTSASTSTSTSTTATKSINSKPKETLLITLQVNSTELAKIKRYDNPLITRGTRGPGKSSKSLFASMMQASKTVSRLEHIQQEKKISPPDDLNREQFHIYEKDDISIPRKLSFEPRERSHREVEIPFDGLFHLLPDMLASKEKNKYVYEIHPISDLREYALTKLPKLHHTPSLQFAFGKIGANCNTELWVDFFQPQHVNDLLMHKQNKVEIYEWISKSFLKLQTQAPLKDMKQKIKKRKQDSFIVYDDEETDDEVHSPFLIIQGSCGSGKSTAVHTVMNELQGYVHEINAGQNRGRKDIYNNLKEFCTTQTVKDTLEFHKGLVLLEDVNILFEQDKTFWPTVQEIINISKRPIILTCEELWNFPKSLIEFAQHDSSMIFIDDYTVLKKLVVDYLWLCCLVHHCDVDNEILNDIIEDNWNGHNFDIRGSLMQCQILCETKSDSLTIIKKSPLEPLTEFEDFDEIANIIDLDSLSDVIQSMTLSRFKPTIQKNEFDDIYWIDDSFITDPTLPYELNIGGSLQSRIANFDHQHDRSTPERKFLMSDLRHEANKFVGSRCKYPHHGSFKKTRTGGGSFSMSETVGVPDTSFLNHMNNNSFILDLLPLARHWSRYQNLIDKFEEDSLNVGKPSIKEFLQYRDFNYQSTLEATINLT